MTLKIFIYRVKDNCKMHVYDTYTNTIAIVNSSIGNKLTTISNQNT